MCGGAALSQIDYCNRSVGKIHIFVLLQEIPQPSLSPSSVTFGSQLVGTTSSPQGVTLTNTNNGTAPLTLSSIVIIGANSPDFSQTNNCPASLAVGANCQINISFAPTATGVRNASLAVTDNAPGSPQSVPLSGTGTTPPPIPYLSPANVSIPSQYVGTSGLPQSVTLNNPGAELVIISVKATPADFATLSAYGSSLAPGASCSIGVFFDPTTSGTRNGTLTVTDSASNSPQTPRHGCWAGFLHGPVLFINGHRVAWVPRPGKVR